MEFTGELRSTLYWNLSLTEVWLVSIYFRPSAADDLRQPPGVVQPLRLATTPYYFHPLHPETAFLHSAPTTTLIAAFLMKASLPSIVVAGVALLAPITSAQQTDPELVGTWTSKSRKVFTGPVCATIFLPSL